MGGPENLHIKYPQVHWDYVQKEANHTTESDKNVKIDSRMTDDGEDVNQKAPLPVCSTLWWWCETDRFEVDRFTDMDGQWKVCTVGSISIYNNQNFEFQITIDKVSKYSGVQIQWQEKRKLLVKKWSNSNSNNSHPLNGIQSQNWLWNKIAAFLLNWLTYVILNWPHGEHAVIWIRRMGKKMRCE